MALYGTKISGLHTGDKIDAKVVEITGDSVVMDVGGKTEGAVSGEDFDEVHDFAKTLKVGEVVPVVVLAPEGRDGRAILSLRHAAINSLWKRLQKAKRDGEEVHVVGKMATERGVSVELESVGGFIPLSQLGKEAIKDTNKLIGKKFSAKIIDLDEERKRVVLSERAVSEAADIELEMKALEELKEGEVLKGKVTQITDFGAFVQVKVKVGKKEIPIEGLVHISQLSWEKVGKTEDVITEGDEVEVMVMGVEDGKASFSIKQAEGDPWRKVEEKYKVDSKLAGKFIKMSGFGAFVELEPGVEGLLHMTKIPPGTSFKRGDSVEVYIEDVDAAARKISLGLVLTSKPVGYK